MNKQRMLKLAGLLNESVIKEASGLSASNLNSLIRYFNDVKKYTTIVCDKTLAAISSAKSNRSEALDIISSAFHRPALNLTNIDSSFEDWFEYWINTEFTEDRFKSSQLNSYAKYFQDLKKQMINLCDKTILALQKLKSKGKNASSSDIDLPESVFGSLALKLTNLDSSFEQWYEYCVNGDNIFRTLEN